MMDINTDQAKGKVKEAVGDLTGNEKLQSEGQADQAAGDGVADKAEDAVDKVKDAFHEE